MQAEGPGLRIAALAVVAIAPDGATRPCSPCGTCRQAIREFAEAAGIVFIAADGAPVVRRIAELLPDAFGAS